MTSARACRLFLPIDFGPGVPGGASSFNSGLKSEFVIPAATLVQHPRSSTQSWPVEKPICLGAIAVAVAGWMIGPSWTALFLLEAIANHLRDMLNCSRCSSVRLSDQEFVDFLS